MFEIFGRHVILFFLSGKSSLETEHIKKISIFRALNKGGQNGVEHDLGVFSYLFDISKFESYNFESYETNSPFEYPNTLSSQLTKSPLSSKTYCY